MKVTLIQPELAWEDRKKNLAHLDGLISSLKEQTDLIVLPEMFATGFTMNPDKFAEPINGESVQWLKTKAKEKNAVIVGSLSVSENGKYFNRLFWVEPDGNIRNYDKRHLFRMAKEDQFYTAGSQRLITKINDFKICPLVCYDLRFPVWSRNRFFVNKNNPDESSWEYDVLIYIANWPSVRSHAWKQLLIARAIENQCYVVGVNRVGKDGNDFDHSGDSVVINAMGEIISDIPAAKEAMRTIVLDKADLETFRKKFTPGFDADEFEIK